MKTTPAGYALLVALTASTAHAQSGPTPKALIDAAIEQGADVILVHHGLFWRGQDGRVTGWMKQRLAQLIRHDINLLAYHLPLDAHPELGNNAQLALRLGLSVQGSFGEQDLGLWGESSLSDPQAFLAQVERTLGRQPVPSRRSFETM